jgi:Bacterial DNA-binding protein
MAQKLSYGDLVARIATNSKLTALEVEEALEVLSVIVQDTLQHGGSVDLLGIGTFSTDKKAVTFQVGQSLREIVADPSAPVVIERVPVALPGKLFYDLPAKHKVNVC